MAESLFFLGPTERRQVLSDLLKLDKYTLIPKRRFGGKPVLYIVGELPDEPIEEFCDNHCFLIFGPFSLTPPIIGPYSVSDSNGGPMINLNLSTAWPRQQDGVIVIGATMLSRRAGTWDETNKIYTPASDEMKAHYNRLLKFFRSRTKPVKLADDSTKRIGEEALRLVQEGKAVFHPPGLAEQVLAALQAKAAVKRHGV